jgi:hypothetical protein
MSSGSGPRSMSSLLSPPTRGATTSETTFTSRVRSPLTTTDTGYFSPSTYTNTFTNTFTNTGTVTDTNTGSLTPTGSLRRPQTSPRSPLTSVRNIVAAWKERTPSLAKSAGSRSGPGSATSGDGISPPQPGRGDGLFRRRTIRRDPGRRHSGDLRDRARAGDGESRPTTPMSGSAGGVPPPFDATELGAYTSESREVSFLLGIFFTFDRYPLSAFTFPCSLFRLCVSMHLNYKLTMALLSLAFTHWVTLVSQCSRAAALQMAKMSSCPLSTYATSFVDRSGRW